jgi:DNA polymerase/3'-5' exonuclease PolX
MELIKAKAIADKWVEMLSPACERIEIAGSIRRNKPEVKDIEIVCKPCMTRMVDMFEEPLVGVSLVDEFIVELNARLLKNGPRYKKIDTREGIMIDLFIVLPPAQWGVLFMLRTGPDDFSHWMVTQRRAGGALPSYYKVQDGSVWKGSRKIEVPEEQDYFALLGMDYIEPGQRAARWIGGER